MKLTYLVDIVCDIYTSIHMVSVVVQTCLDFV